MGDGKVALILDVLGLAHNANVLTKDRERSTRDTMLRSKDNAELTQTLLVLQTGTGRRLALPISQVARLEKIAVEALEYTDDREVVQYRGEILPLIRLANALGMEDDFDPPDGLLNIVVYSERNLSYGLVVNRIVDIVETTLEVSRNTHRAGLLGSSVIQEHVTDIVDLPAIFRQFEVPCELVSTISN